MLDFVPRAPIGLLGVGSTDTPVLPLPFTASTSACTASRPSVRGRYTVQPACLPDRISCLASIVQPLPYILILPLRPAAWAALTAPAIIWSPLDTITSRSGCAERTSCVAFSAGAARYPPATVDTILMFLWPLR